MAGKRGVSVAVFNIHHTHTHTHNAHNAPFCSYLLVDEDGEGAQQHDP